MVLTVGKNNIETRVKWLEAALAKIPAGLTILDAGAGESQFKKFCSHLNYISQDFGKYEGTGDTGLQMGSWDNSQLDIVSDITSIPLQDNFVDAIMCTEVFEHIPNPVLAIHEFKRLLKPGGYLIITAPFASLTHFAPYHFASGLSRYFYEHHLAENGFNIIELDFNGNFFEFVAQENWRILSMASKYTSTKLNFLERRIIQLNCWLLQKLSKRDIGSSEVLCFGIHVFARKNEEN